MTQSVFISIETVDGIVTAVEGQYRPTKPTGYGIFGGGFLEPQGQRINDMLNLCADAGYEHFFTEVIGKKVVHRLKLKSK